MQIARLSAQGISMHLARPAALQALHKTAHIASPDDSKHQSFLNNFSKRLADAESDASLARQEKDNGFPVLHSFIVAAIWIWLEDFVKGLAALWLSSHDNAMYGPAVSKLKIRLGDYLRLSDHERAFHIVELLDQDRGASLRGGVNRFQCLLECIELNFDIDEDKKEDAL